MGAILQNLMRGLLFHGLLITGEQHGATGQCHAVPLFESIVEALHFLRPQPGLLDVGISARSAAEGTLCCIQDVAHACGTATVLRQGPGLPPEFIFQPDDVILVRRSVGLSMQPDFGHHPPSLQSNQAVPLALGKFNRLAFF